MKNRIFSVITIITLLIYIFLNLVFTSYSYAAQTKKTYNATEIEKYTGYKELIEEMKKKHPKWNFTILYTGLDWNTVITNETTASHGRSVVPSSWSNVWKCSTHINTAMGGSSWRCASTAAVSYYMDPRNWINDDYIFQFERLSYNKDIQTIDGVKKIISSIKYMQGDKITYTKTDGTKATLNKSYAQVIMEAAQEANISPYHLATRLKQEQGAGTTPGSTATGTYGNYKGYYNFLNIKASGSVDSEVIANGLTYAKNQGWTDPEKSIKGGAKFLASGYIGYGQDTLYLQKFDVDSSDGDLYWHQYMQNIAAAANESTGIRDSYKELGLLDNSIDFVIPVFENMPSIPCAEPREASTVTQNVQIKGTNVNIRSGPGTSYSVVTTQSNGYNMLRIEMAKTQVSGYYWDKVILSDGRLAYVARQYLNQVADITNCNETVTVTGSGVYLRNGPGTSGTTVVATLNKGQLVTRIEKGKYNLNGYVWDRVKLSDGTQGYMASTYLSLVNSSTPTTPTTPTTNNKYKVDGNNFICEPSITIENIKADSNYKDAVVKNSSGQVVTSGNVGTGYTITVSGKTYTVVKLGDINGDGMIDTGDTFFIKQVIMGTRKLTADCYNKAADVNSDGSIDTGDSFLLKKQVMNTGNITI